MTRALVGWLLLGLWPLAAQATNADLTPASAGDGGINYITDDRAATNAASSVDQPRPIDAAPSSPATTGPTPPSGTTYFAPSPQAAPNNLGPTSGPAAKDDIDDIRPPFFFLHGWLWLWITLAVLALATLIYLLWRWFRPRPHLNPKTAYDLALENLARARELLNPEDPKPYATAVSETVRTYLGQRFEAPSTRRTTEEFLRQMQADATTPLAAHRELLRDFLQACDLVKFARYRPGLDELGRVHERATNFVVATKPLPANGATA